ncbi:hypothetical protein KZZ52_21265 [Dactylosporangium sp. AC04546]|uniref:hypothetical protein n=1 Tax=Dactylosporangium sp. AC04546 TaxID=2862460 RepID=UPI001EDE2A58|nr:hypothetical protein [Dactylosporangium sp. AC04546]WVK87815.1 hypothetical protein KZZ52_21265 [Dactylosporangium sp. AC04546]
MAAAAKTDNSKVINAVWVVGVVVVGICVAAFFSSSGDDEAVTPPSSIDAASVVAGLDRAAKAHGVCYGWQLYASSTEISAGSNLGAGKRANEDPTSCAKYIVVRGTYYYYSDSSDSEDYAYYTFVTNVDAPTRLDSAALDQVGVGTKQLLDDPSQAILGAAEALPLIAQQAGIVSGAVPEPTATGSVAPLPSTGSDFWRDRWVLVLVSSVLLLGALVTLIFGIRSSRRFKRGEETDPFATPAAKTTPAAAAKVAPTGKAARPGKGGPPRKRGSSAAAAQRAKAASAQAAAAQAAAAQTVAEAASASTSTDAAGTVAAGTVAAGTDAAASAAAGTTAAATGAAGAGAEASTEAAPAWAAADDAPTVAIVATDATATEAAGETPPKPQAPQP